MLNLLVRSETRCQVFSFSGDSGGETPAPRRHTRRPGGWLRVGLRGAADPPSGHRKGPDSPPSRPAPGSPLPECPAPPRPLGTQGSASELSRVGRKLSGWRVQCDANSNSDGRPSMNSDSLRTPWRRPSMRRWRSEDSRRHRAPCRGSPRSSTADPRCRSRRAASGSPPLLRKKRPKASGALNYYCLWQVVDSICHDQYDT
jgi:hypothetical protein